MYNKLIYLQIVNNFLIHVLCEIRIKIYMYLPIKSNPNTKWWYMINSYFILTARFKYYTFKTFKKFISNSNPFTQFTNRCKCEIRMTSFAKRGLSFIPQYQRSVVSIHITEYKFSNFVKGIATYVG